MICKKCCMKGSCYPEFIRNGYGIPDNEAPKIPDRNRPDDESPDHCIPTCLSYEALQSLMNNFLFIQIRLTSGSAFNYYCMDAACLLPVLMLDLKAGDSLLDMCAGSDFFLTTRSFSRSYQTFFGIKLGHFIVNKSFFHKLQTLKLNSKIWKTKKNKVWLD